jgi:hypothetical protein
VEHDKDRQKSPAVYSKTIRAGRRRTYFFDVRTTKSNDYYITLTESKKKFNEDGYDRHKIFLYKEDFNKFIEALTNTVNHVKEDLLPEYDFDEFNKEYDDDDDYGHEREGDDFDRPRREPREHRTFEPRATEQKPVEKTEEVTAKAEVPLASVAPTVTTNSTQPATNAAADEFTDEDLKWD